MYLFQFKYKNSKQTKSTTSKRKSCNGGRGGKTLFSWCQLCKITASTAEHFDLFPRASHLLFLQEAPFLSHFQSQKFTVGHSSGYHPSMTSHHFLHQAYKPHPQGTNYNLLASKFSFPLSVYLNFLPQNKQFSCTILPGYLNFFMPINWLFLSVSSSRYFSLKLPAMYL